MVGVAAHITAASPGGPRYDPTLSSEERSSEQNGVWTCQTHGKLIDDNSSLYTVEQIRTWKKQHEEWVFSRIANAENNLRNGISQISLEDVGPFDKRGKIKMGRSNVVCGVNGTGKSTLCEAIAAFSGKANFERFAKRFGFFRSLKRKAMIEAVASRDDVAIKVLLSAEKFAFRRAKTSPAVKRLHIEIDGNVAPSWPLSLFNVVLLHDNLFMGPNGPKDRLKHAIWCLSEQLNIGEQTIWDLMRDEMFITSTFGYRISRTSIREVEVLAPHNRHYHPFAQLSSSEQCFALVDILLKVLQTDPRNPPWLLIFDSSFIGGLITANKQYLFDTITSKMGFPLQTIFVVSLEEDAEILRTASSYNWIGADSIGQVTVHAFH